jgi:hypothetical protein
MSCLILGDSIAVGLSTALKGCMTIAKVGMSSAWILAHAPAVSVDTAYISAGANDPGNPALASNLARIKQRVHAGRYVFIAPANSSRARAIACAAGPCVSYVAGRDGVHPASYGALAASVLQRG